MRFSYVYMLSRLYLLYSLRIMLEPKDLLSLNIAKTLVRSVCLILYYCSYLISDPVFYYICTLFLFRRARGDNMFFIT